MTDFVNNKNRSYLMSISSTIIKFLSGPSYIWDKFLFVLVKRTLRHAGKNIYMRPSKSDFKGLWNMSIGDDSIIPKGSVFYCTRAPLTIGRKVIFGPNPTIITGNHCINKIGKFIADITDAEKFPENDAPVVIEDDVWCGANVTILKGVTIGRGSVVAAGAVVTKSFPPYSIIGGVPAKIIRMRFTPEQIIEHEKILYG